LELRIAFVELAGLEGAQQLHQYGHGIGGAIGIGHVALDPLHDDLGVDRAAPAHLDHVAEGFGRGGLAHHAVVDDLALGRQRLHDHLRPVGGDPLLVAGDQKRQ
jgi:hypothetical protein